MIGAATARISDPAPMPRSREDAPNAPDPDGDVHLDEEPRGDEGVRIGSLVEDSYQRQEDPRDRRERCAHGLHPVPGCSKEVGGERHQERGRDQHARVVYPRVGRARAPQVAESVPREDEPRVPVDADGYREPCLDHRADTGSPQHPHGDVDGFLLQTQNHLLKMDHGRHDDRR